MKNLSAVNKYAHVMGLGIEMAVTMALPILLGIYIDGRFEIRPWGVLLGVLFGLLALISRLYKLTIMFNRTKRTSINSNFKDLHS
jgi:F0F1-type ATP synthase assembly protein I